MYVSIWKDSKSQLSLITLPFRPLAACLNYISSDSELYEFPSLSPCGLRSVLSLCCNQEIVLALLSDGTVFGWGSNTSGLLGPSISCTSSPIQLERLQNITQISISDSHAAVVDSAGLLYTWGCPLYGKLGYHSVSKTTQPSLVLSSKAFKSIQVSCGQNFTCVRSDGCFIHIYGELGQCHISNSKAIESKSPKGIRSYSHPELDNYSVISLVGGKKFIAALIDTGEVFALDGCMDLVKLPIQCESNIKEIVALQDSIWGISTNFLLNWRLSQEKRIRAACELAAWTAQVFEAEEVEGIWKWGSGFMMSSASETMLSNELHELSPYKRSDYARRLFVNAMESPTLSFKKENRVPLDSFEDLERLFPTGDSQHTMEKIIKCRIEHHKYEVILKAFKPIVHPIAEEALSKIKEFAWVSNIYKITMAVSNLYSVVYAFSKKAAVLNKSKFFNRLKTLRKVHKIVTDPHSRMIIEKTCEILAGQSSYTYKSAYFAIKKEKNPVCNALGIMLRYYNRRCKHLKKGSFRSWKLLEYLTKAKQVSLSSLFEILRLNYLHQATFVLKNYSKSYMNRICILKKFIQIFEMQSKLALHSAFHKLKGNMMNSILIKFHRKYILELFLKLLTSRLQSQLSKGLQSSFSLLKSYKKPLSTIESWALLFEQKSLQVKSLIFSSVCKPKAHSYKSPLSPLLSLLRKASKAFFRKIMSALTHKTIQQFTSLALVLNKVFSKSEFINKLKVLNLLKHRSFSRSQSVNNEEDFLLQYIDSASDISKPSESRPNLDQLYGNSLDVNLYKQSRSISSPQAIRKSHQCWYSVNSPPSSKTSELSLTKFYKGEKMSYEKYLILKKIEEVNDSSPSESKSPITTPKKKKMAVEKPPWKPASYFSSFSTEKKNESAIKKGFQYNELLRKKLMKQRASSDLSESQQTCITHDKGLIVKQTKEMFSKENVADSVSNIVSLPFCKGTLSIGLGTMILDRILQKVTRLRFKEMFHIVKKVQVSPSKLPAPIPIDSPKVAQNDTILMIKSSWKLGVVIIGSDKTKSFMRKLAGRELFDLLVSSH